ncbi:MAG: LLM class flavin-dependent oxidoreductase, partial [Actinobacteria bacterium]|nr:LLM class flavin-dependent oxidoreductase [Actinomycetota bacterium]
SPLPIVPNDDVEAAADVIRPMLALYIGGMGAKGANFHFDVFARMGYEAECITIQDLYLDGKKNEAIAAVPLKLVEDVALVGPIAKILDELPRWKETVITTAQISAPVEMLETVASILE